MGSSIGAVVQLAREDEPVPRESGPVARHGNAGF